MQIMKKRSSFAKASAGKERMTVQKNFIFNYLKSVKTHPTAEVVYKEVKKKLPNISQGTVYRVLNNLKEKGEIISIDTKDNVHFDAFTDDHAHFICEKCNQVFDVIDECSKCGILKNKRIKIGKINHYKINFYGICSVCKK